MQVVKLTHLNGLNNGSHLFINRGWKFDTKSQVPGDSQARQKI